MSEKTEGLVVYRDHLIDTSQLTPQEISEIEAELREENARAEKSDQNPLA